MLWVVLLWQMLYECLFPSPMCHAFFSHSVSCFFRRCHTEHWRVPYNPGRRVLSKTFPHMFYANWGNCRHYRAVPVSHFQNVTDPTHRPIERRKTSRFNHTYLLRRSYVILRPERVVTMTVPNTNWKYYDIKVIYWISFQWLKNTKAVKSRKSMFWFQIFIMPSISRPIVSVARNGRTTRLLSQLRHCLPLLQVHS